MARSDYELSAEIFGADELPRLLEADLADRCTACAKEDIAAAQRNLTAVGTWWMSEVGRRARDVRTRITVFQRTDGAGSEAWFAIQVPRWNKAIRIFSSLVQHTLQEGGARKKRPHYQLQVPCVKELNDDVRGSGYEARVKDLGNTLRTRLESLQHVGVVSIPLSTLSEDDLGKIKKEIAVLIETLGRWEWGAL